MTDKLIEQNSLATIKGLMNTTSEYFCLLYRETLRPDYWYINTQLRWFKIMVGLDFNFQTNIDRFDFTPYQMSDHILAELIE